MVFDPEGENSARTADADRTAYMDGVCDDTWRWDVVPLLRLDDLCRLGMTCRVWRDRVSDWRPDLGKKSRFLSGSARFLGGGSSFGYRKRLMIVADVKGYHDVYGMFYSKDVEIYSSLEGVQPRGGNGIVDILCDHLISVGCYTHADGSPGPTVTCNLIGWWLAGAYRISEASIQWMTDEAAVLPEVKMCVAARAGKWEVIKTCVVRLGRRVEGMWDDVMAHAARGGHRNIVNVCAFKKGATDWGRAARYASAGGHGELAEYCEGMALAH